MKKLGEHDVVITAYAEPAVGPGWANQPVWVVVRSRLDGTIRQICLQPFEQSAEMLYLYSISAAVHAAMTGAAQMHLTKDTSGRSSNG